MLCFLYRPGIRGRDDETAVKEEKEGGGQYINGRCMSWRLSIVRARSAERELEI